MTIEEIFRDLSTHMIRGVMLHEQQADAYDFLNLHGYKRMSEYHMYKEMKSLRSLHRYYINHYNKLIDEGMFENPDVIPKSWYNYKRQEVDTNTKRQSVRSAIEEWVRWEEETKDKYQKMYLELIDLGEIASADKIMCFVNDVNKELKWAQRCHIDLATADYDIGFILGKQDYYHDWYKSRM